MTINGFNRNKSFQRITGSLSTGVVASGGTESTIGSFKYHKFTSLQQLEVTSTTLTWQRSKVIRTNINTPSTASTSVTVFAIGAGGGGGSQVGGGGGGGGSIIRTDFVLVKGTYVITAGGGGSGGSGPPGQVGSQGTPTTLTLPSLHPFGALTYTALGGGGGGRHPTPSNTSMPEGGCGGGGGGAEAGAPSQNNGKPGSQPSQTNPGFTQYGNAGGNAVGSPWFGAGGGGAGGNGTNGVPGQGGPGGSGRTFPNIPPAFGVSGVFGGGGGGCRDGMSGSNGTGGPGGGGNGIGDEGSSPLKNGASESGGGGGGVRDNSGPGGQGGSGVIIIAYPVA